jgi:glucosyl-dolichyl phosphate glucuronosyltransferase
MSHDVSIAIPTYNRAALLRRALDSLRPLDIPPGLQIEVLVIDNNCTDDTAAVTADAASRLPFTVRRIVENVPGLCCARNRALAEAAHEYVVFFDDDVDVSPGWLSGFIEAAGTFGADCVVGPVFPLIEGAIPAHVTPAILDQLTSPYSRKGDRALVLPARTAWEVPGCNFGVRRRVALEVGGFDAAFDRKGAGLLAGGDFEFGDRLVRAGHRVVYEPRCSVRHLVSAAKMTRAYLRRRWHGVGMARRLLDRQRGSQASLGLKLRAGAGALRLAAESLLLRLAGRHDQAFEKELHAIEALGYFRRM